MLHIELYAVAFNPTSNSVRLHPKQMVVHIYVHVDMKKIKSNVIYRI